MDGIELLREVKAVNPEIRTRLISAFDIEDKIIHDCGSIDKRLQKPIAMN